jgi:hypothetical protein
MAPLELACLTAVLSACTPDFGKFHRAPHDAGVDAGREAGTRASDAAAASNTSVKDSAAVKASQAGAPGGDAAAAGPARDAGMRTRPNDAATDASTSGADANVSRDSGTRCAAGFRAGTSGCTDIDECAEATHTCHPSATCKNTEGSFDCTCPLGFAGGTPTGFACRPRIAVGVQHTCGLLMSGHVLCWGDNTNGQLGDGTMMNSTSPVAVSGIANAVGIEAGGSCTCAVLSDRTVTCWGTYPVPGNSSHLAATPEGLAGQNDVAMVSTDGTHSCLVRMNGHVACWGSALAGALGNGVSSNTMAFNPMDVAAVTDVQHVSTGAAGNERTCATRKDGNVLCWAPRFWATERWP